MEKDNDSKEESSDYSCSPITKNELLTAAKYCAIKFAILLVPAISNLSVPFHLFKVLKQTPSCSPSENRRTKEKISPLSPSRPISHSRKFQFFQDSVFSIPLFPSILYILTFYLLFFCRSQFLPSFNPKTCSSKNNCIFTAYLYFHHYNLINSCYTIVGIDFLSKLLLL